MEKKGSEEKIGVVDLKRANLLRRLGLKITPAWREYCRYTGVSAEVEKHGLDHSDDSRYKPRAPENRKHGH